MYITPRYGPLKTASTVSSFNTEASLKNMRRLKRDVGVAMGPVNYTLIVDGRLSKFLARWVAQSTFLSILLRWDSIQTNDERYIAIYEMIRLNLDVVFFPRFMVICNREPCFFKISIHSWRSGSVIVFSSTLTNSLLKTIHLELASKISEWYYRQSVTMLNDIAFM